MSLSGKRMLQVCVAVAGIVPVAAGAWGVLDRSGSASADWASHARYLSGVLLAIGVASWATIPDIERRTGRIQLLASLVMTGGLCRLLGLALGDALSPETAGALVMELLVTPLLCLWQARLGVRGLDGR